MSDFLGVAILLVPFVGYQLGRWAGYRTGYALGKLDARIEGLRSRRLAPHLEKNSSQEDGR